MELVKNDTRISSLMGTWTAQTEIKSSVGDYKAVAYFVVHFMPDPMRGHGCELEGCHEIDNEICARSIDRKEESETCVSMEDTVMEWSDVSAFVNFGARVDAGFPFFVHKYHDTGDWIGPLSVVMAQNESAVVDIDDVVDQYSIRYVQTPTTPYLRMDPNCTLFSPDDFQKYMGMTAVKETIKVQSNTTHGKDPYEQYLGTCQNGDVRPILPLMEFTFVKSPDEPEKESVQVQLDYKVLSFPHKSDIMYKLFPRLQKRLNQPGSGFHVSGPYCYGEDPKRGYTFDFTYDSRHETNLLDLVHGCVEGFPCLPSAAEIQPASGGASVIHNNTVDKNVHTLNVGPVVTLSLLVTVLSLGLIVSMVFHFRSYRRYRQQQQEDEEGEAEQDDAVPGSLEEPLLPNGDEGQDGGDDGDIGQDEAEGTPSA